MLEAQRTDCGSTEVCVIPENRRCGEVSGHPESGVRILEALCSDVSGFSWEEVTVSGRGVSSFRLLAVGAQCELKLLEVEADRSASISLLRVHECPSGQLLEAIRERDSGVSELQSVRVLSFAAGRCYVLLNCDWLLQLRWQRAEEEPQTLSCCSIQLTDGNRHNAVHHIVCRETLFVLSSTGLTSVFSVSDGRLLASIDFPAYLSSGPADDDLVSSPPSFSSSSSFCLLQVSADLSTAVAVTRSHTAVAVDLNHYFRIYPDHLLCAAAPSRPPLRPQQPRDQDSLSSSNCSLLALGSTFSTDRSWEARLASMYSRAQQATASSSSTRAAGTSWSSSLPHLEFHQAPSSAHSRVPHGGATVVFSVPESSAPSLLTVSEFSAQLAFVTPSNTQTTVALWDLESGSVSYHRAEGEAAPVQRCGERQHQLLLKSSGVFLVLFSVSQQDLLSRLMLFGSAATVDAVCHLNSWGRCSIPIHALQQAGLKNRQLDTVDFYLKSKENILNPADEQPAACSLSLSDHEDAGVQSCVDVLDRYVTELRRYMKRFPWPVGGDTSSTSSADPAQVEEEEEEWKQLQTEEVVRHSILTNQIPRAQAVLRRRNRPEQRLSALRMEGLRQVFCCLQRRDLQTANTLLTNMVEELSGRSYFPEDEMQSVAFIKQMEKLGSQPAARCPAKTTLHRVVQMVHKQAGCGGDEVLEELVGQKRSEDEGVLWRNLRLDWVRNWDQSCQAAVLLSRLQHTELTSCDSAVLWRYLTALHDQRPGRRLDRLERGDLWRLPVA
ncbi:Spatacsin [Nibea albiflora]|uniref:Spatacsin n=1 Tax=Nibea albiflora TaxID=240163 RepID=A0ACB7FEQ4_NIBAL|nr:Spatacsin [Nibea albiflora]